MMLRQIGFPLAFLTLSLSATVHGAHAQIAPTATTSSFPAFQSWMHPDLPAAWTQGYRGQGVAITVVDEWSGRPGNPDDRFSQIYAVASLAKAVAPSASLWIQSSYQSGPIVLPSKGLNVLTVGYQVYTSKLESLDQSVVNAARRGQAVVVAAAGNAGTDMRLGGIRPSLLQTSLIGAQSAIFVGALDRNGDMQTGSLAKKTPYSNKAGDNSVSSQFVMVGVENNAPLGSTAGAAAIVSGYAAILGSKFKTAEPIRVTWQILNTARRDTIQNYSLNVHGRGEASLSRALAPATIK